MNTNRFLHCLWSSAQSLRGDTRGATAIEYSLIALLIAVAIIVSVAMLGESLENEYDEVSTQVNQATGEP